MDFLIYGESTGCRGPSPYPSQAILKILQTAKCHATAVWADTCFLLPERCAPNNWDCAALQLPKPWHPGSLLPQPIAWHPSACCLSYCSPGILAPAAAATAALASWSLLPQLLKPVYLELVLCDKRSHGNKKPTYHNEEKPLLITARCKSSIATNTQPGAKNRK